MISLGKMVNGDMVVGDFSEDNNEMHDTKMVIIQPDSNGGLGMALAGLLSPLSESMFTVDGRHLVAVEAIEYDEKWAEFVRQYNSVVSGITIHSDLSGLN